MSVKRAQSEIDALEFQEWQDYYAQQPWGEERADWRAAMLASTIANRHRNPKREKVYKESDFMPNFERRPRTQTPSQMQAIFRIATQAINHAYAEAGIH